MTDRIKELEEIIYKQATEIEHLYELISKLQSMIRSGDDGCPYYARIKDIDPKDKRRLRTNMEYANVSRIIRGPKPCPYDLNFLETLRPEPKDLEKNLVYIVKEDGSRVLCKVTDDDIVGVKLKEPIVVSSEDTYEI